jgi:hypothetical protein
MGHLKQHVRRIGMRNSFRIRIRAQFIVSTSGKEHGNCPLDNLGPMASNNCV